MPLPQQQVPFPRQPLRQPHPIQPRPPQQRAAQPHPHQPHPAQQQDFLDFLDFLENPSSLRMLNLPPT